MRVELLLAPDCPHADAARVTVDRCLEQLGLDTQVIERLGDYPSPTLLVDGVDVMNDASGTPRALACRLDVPTESRVLAALHGHRLWGRRSVVTASEAYPPDLARGATGERVASLADTARRVHRAVLLAFAATGEPPDRATLVQAAGDAAAVDSALHELHDRDVIRLDGTDAIRAAYPFSGVPTPHRVALADGPTVYAMCAIDALGMSTMLGRAVTIRSSDPTSDEPITVSVSARQAHWEPTSAVVFVGAIDDRSTQIFTLPDDGTPCCHAAPAADRCCTVMNFFTSPDSAGRWQSERPEVTGLVLTQPQALRLGIDIFGQLLNDQSGRPA